MPHALSRPVLAIALLASLPATLLAQATSTAKTTPVVFDADSARLAELPWRSIGPAVTSLLERRIPALNAGLDAAKIP